MYMQVSKKILFIIIIPIVIFLGLGGYIWLYELEHQNLEVITLDIGQGDAILIKTPFKQNVLIDGGPNKSIARALDRNLPFWRRKISLMILTHPDVDHVNGLVEVLERYQVDRVMGTGVAHTAPGYLMWLELIKNKKIPFDVARAPQTIKFGPDLKMEIIYPWDDYGGKDAEDNNITSIVAKLIYKNNSFLLTGDAPIESEQEMIGAGLDLKSDVLKVGHHGSKNSTSQVFVQMVQPKYAVISCGKDNLFGHPNLRVLKNLEKIGARILRTDEAGDAVLISDGKKVRAR